MYQQDPRQKPLPTMYDLPSEDPEEPGLPDEFHEFQPQLLRETCHPPNYSTQEFFVATDLNLYYDVEHPLWHKRPDWFLVLGKAPAQKQEDLRWSYVIWQEGIAPFLVVELLSPGTEAEDLGQTLREVNTPPTKWQVYEQLLRIPYYAVFDRYQNQFRLFRLVATRYEELPLTEKRHWFEEMQLGLGVWQGFYGETEGLWLRWYDAESNWLLFPSEQVQQERQRTEEQRQRAERLATRLRELGADPEQL
jgi:Uma2 family endonuclease